MLHEAHPKGRVILKFNHLTDPELLEALVYAASRGARVDLLVRSTLTRLHPAIRAKSLVGRFLEHARAAAFRAGGVAGLPHQRRRHAPQLPEPL